MNPTRSIFRNPKTWIHPSLVLLACGLFSCIQQGGILDPSKTESQIPLGHFVGRAYIGTDTAITAQRLFNLKNPKIALVWQFIGPKEFTWAPSESVNKAVADYDFSIDLRDPPPKEVLESPDLAAGTFWLFSDANSNGFLDRLIHPEMLKLNLAVDSMYALYTTAMDRLREVSEIKSDRVQVMETYYIGRYGSVIRMVDGKPDTIWNSPSPALLKQEMWISILNCRFRVLNDPNRWEKFFALRKRDNDYYRIQKPAEGYAFAYDFPYERKLFALPGKEAEFETRLRDATWALINFLLNYTMMTNNAVSAGYVDFPYNGFDQPGQDWVAGRSVAYVVLYLRDQAGYDELLQAEKNSSFSVLGKDKIHLGYNLVHCDAQYQCEVLDPKDSIHIELGSSESYFNPPANPLTLPIKVLEEHPLPASYLQSFQGAYKYQPFRPLTLMVENGILWTSVPDLGTYALLPTDSLLFYAPAANLQFQFVKEAGQITKLLIYSAGKRFVALPDSASPIPLEEKNFIEKAAGRSGIHIAAESLAPFAGGYAFAADTLKVEASELGDSLKISAPGMTPHFYRAENDSVFFSPYCDCRAGFRHDEKGQVTDVLLEREGISVCAPNLARVPRAPADLFPALPANPDSLVSESQGNLHDTYVGLDGKGRYAESADGLYLSAGSGWVYALDHSLPGDSISLSRGQEGIVFRLTGLQGSAAALDLRLRRDVQAGLGRARFRLRGGADPARMDIVLSDDFWIEFQNDSAAVALKPLPVSSDPFYIRLEQVPTAETLFPIAFDSYSIFAAKADHAGP